MRIVAVSDTHNAPFGDVPRGDVFIHCGDATMRGTKPEVAAFGEQLDALKHEHILFVPGNHDWLFETHHDVCRSLLPDRVQILDHDSFGVRIDGVRFWGSPYSRELPWAFSYGDEFGEELWRAVPETARVVITHEPAFGIGDVCSAGHVGSKALRDRLRQVQPKLHLFGHVHEDGGGRWTVNGTLHANVAALDRKYQPARGAAVFDLEDL